MQVEKKIYLEIYKSIKLKKSIPLKFAYTYVGAKKWASLMENSSHKKVGARNLEEPLLKKIVKSLCRKIQSKKYTLVRVFDFGCGTGIPVEFLLRDLSQQTNIEYYPIDISLGLLKQATHRAKFIDKKIKVIPKQVDFDFLDIKTFLKPYDGNNETLNLFLFLGNTLANINNSKTILCTLFDRLKYDDLLVTGIELLNREHIEHFSEYYGSESAKDFIYQIPRKIGINRSNSKFEVLWNKKESQVEVFLVAIKDIQLKNGYVVKNGARLMMAKSKKFTKDKVRELMKFPNSKKLIYGSKGYQLSVVSKIFEQNSINKL